jgi:hypothetical protein
MPSRRSQSPDAPQRPRLRRSREEATRLLQERIELGKELAARINPGAYLPNSLSQLEAEYSRWSSYNKELLRTLFDTDEVADNYDRFIGVA